MGLTTDLVHLNNGPIVPLDVVTWLINAESRGLEFCITDSDKLRVSPCEKVQADDDEFIRQHRDVLKDCVNYIARMCEAPL